ncbi:cyclic peptide export ABC transporter [Massilia scottii]|uniref:cyclic peptide export ABC transporter n=1 Tax=Massilia scottii TaxID=3057166 RepID=UPI002796CCE2|nr:cyclic peptide export ABC transporter [Massilia sp. CCM 9029]MDQ1830400.1 cyclic peptide export ABC transporter [Massilia sp. CCM 9029]
MLKTLLYQRRWILLFCVLLCALTAITNLSLLDFLNDQVTKASNSDPAAWLPKYFLGIGALFATSMLASGLLVGISSGALADIRIQLLKGVLSTHFPELERTGKGALLGVMTDDIDNLANGLSDAPQFFMNLITSIACFSYLAWLSPYAFAWFFGTVVLGGGLTMFILHQGNIRYAAYRKLKDQYYVHMNALFDGAKELATNIPRRRHFAQRELFPSVMALKKSQIVWDMYWHFGQAWSSVLLFLALGVAIAAVQNSGHYGLGLITSYFVIITFVAGSVDFVISGVSTMAKALVSARVVSRMKLGEDRYFDTDQDCDGLQDWKQIHFDRVTYDSGLVDGQSFALGPISLTLRRGEVLFLVGGNGSGKSTYAKVLNGLYQRSGGAIRVDSREIPIDTSVAYRSLFSTVYSDYFLFQSVLDRSGHPVGEAETHEKLALLRMEDKVSAHDGAWTTTALSQGQRKRLALLQCWLDDASVYVLDEWAADQDPGYRAHFYEVLLPIMKSQGKTLVIISHDERYFHLADRVCKFDSGNIVRSDESVKACA